MEPERDSRFIWWALATLLIAMVMAMSMSMGAGREEYDAAVGQGRSVMLMAAVICLPFGLAAMIAGLMMTVRGTTRPLAKQLLGYGATLGIAVFAILIIVATQWQ